MRCLSPTLLAGVLFVGGACAAPPPKQPLASPQATCTADGLRTAGPCTQLDRDDQVSLQARAAEAEKVLRQVIAEEDRLQLSRATEPSARLQELCDEPYLRQSRRHLREMVDGYSGLEGGPTRMRISLVADSRRKGATVSICAEQSSQAFTLVGKDGTRSLGHNHTDDYFFRTEDGKLRLYDAAGRSDEKCKS